MSETMRINLTKTAVFVALLMTLASVVGGGYIAYDNAKTAKIDIKELQAEEDLHNAELDRRMTQLETRQARFEGVIDERTKNTQTDVKRIYDIVKEWER